MLNSQQETTDRPVSRKRTRRTAVRSASGDKFIDNDSDGQTATPFSVKVSEDVAPTADVHAEEVNDGEGTMEEQMDTIPAAVATTASESTASVKVTWEAEAEMADDMANGNSKEREQTVKKDNSEAKSGKRKAESIIDLSPSKKNKCLNEGHCLFVGSLNTSKTFDEVQNSLVNYFTAHSLLIRDLRLDHSRRFAYIDFCTEEDLSQALKLNGEKILDKPMRIDKAKVKEVIPKDKQAKDARTLFVKNIPFSATKDDLMKVFDGAVNIRFPGGSDCPNKGIAYVEFKTQAIADSVLKEKQGTDISGRVIVVECLREINNTKAKKAPAVATPTNTLIVNNLTYKVKKDSLKKVFKKAVGVRIPQSNGKPRGYAFVEFKSENDARDAIKSSQNTEISGRAIRLEFGQLNPVREDEKVLSKTLIVMGLTEETSTETLKGAFEGSISARITTDKDTGVSRGFGFVEFENPEDCKAAKDAMEDCEIDGCKVTVNFASPSGALRRGVRGKPGGRGRGGRGGRQRGHAGGRGGGSGKKFKDGKQEKKKVKG